MPVRLQAIADILTKHYHSECGETDCDHTPTEVAAEIVALDDGQVSGD